MKPIIQLYFDGEKKYLCNAIEEKFSYTKNKLKKKHLYGFLRPVFIRLNPWANIAPVENLKYTRLSPTTLTTVRNNENQWVKSYLDCRI
jgi:hypothetical protein